MKKENIKFYLLITFSIVIYISGFILNKISVCGGGIAFLLIGITPNKCEDKMILKISKILTVLMGIGLIYITFIG